ncbi:MAG: SIR2 family protein, partial [Alphaproteobacteria bacterium]
VMQGSLSDSDWKLLLHRIKEGRCTPFLGAGASFPALPLGGGVAEKWSAEHNYPLADRTDLPRVAQYLAVTYDSMFPKEELANSFKKCAPPDFSARDEPHGVLSRLPLPIYMTTNYDDFMIRALKAQGREGVRETCRWKSDIKHLPSEFEKGYVPSAQQPVVFHLHGYLDETKSMVLTEDDYLDFLMRISTDQHILPPRVQEAFTDSTLLFLGYGLADWNFRVLFRALVEYLDKSSTRSHVSVQLSQVREDMTDEQKESVQNYFDKHFSSLRIRVFWGTCRDFVSELSRRWEAFDGHG